MTASRCHLVQGLTGRTAAAAALVCGLVLGAPAAVQATSDRPQVSGGPPGRAWPALAYDPALRELVLFGGDNGTTVYGSTWIYRDDTWTKEHPAAAPSPRTGAALVYDAATRQLLLFGGSSEIGTGGGFLGDTWTWNGRTWTQLHPANSPPARHNADVIYDAADRNVVLFGGFDGQYLGAGRWPMTQPQVRYCCSAGIVSKAASTPTPRGRGTASSGPSSCQGSDPAGGVTVR